MHRNTYLVVSILGIFAALVVGVNIGKSMKPQESQPTLTPTPTVPTETVLKTYTNAYCGFSIDLPTTLTVMDNASGSAIFNNPSDATQSIAMTCQKEIPRPPLTQDKIDRLSLVTPAGSTVSATLYHDQDKDGSPVNSLIFTHPINTMDIFIAGYGETFDAAIKSIHIL